MRCLAARDNALNILNSHFTEKLLSLGLKGLKVTLSYQPTTLLIFNSNVWTKFAS